MCGIVNAKEGGEARPSSFYEVISSLCGEVNVSVSLFILSHAHTDRVRCVKENGGKRKQQEDVKKKCLEGL